MTVSIKKDRRRPDPRTAALKILCRYFRVPGSLKDYLMSAFVQAGFSGPDRRFIFNLVKGTVRHYMLIDFAISCFSSRRIRDIEPRVLNILRMGVYQVMFMDRVPHYSVVDESVKMAGKGSGAPASGFVNAVLRKITGMKDIAGYTGERLVKSAKSRAEVISIRYSFPLWLVKYWIGYYGEDRTESICGMLNSNPVFYIMINRLKAGNKGKSNEIIEELQKEIPGAVQLKDVEVSGASYDARDVFSVSSTMDLEKSRLYREGYITVQNLPSQLAVKYFLEPQPGERILDVCAAPGGKTAYSAQMMENLGMIACVDASNSRIEMMEQNLSRMGIENTVIVKADAACRDFLEEKIKFSNEGAGINERQWFDRVIVDPPCSALGTASKNPEAKYAHGMKDIRRLAEMQYKILLNSSEYLKPGGRMVYYTCTLSLHENQELVERFISENRGGFIMDPGYAPAQDGPGGRNRCNEIMPQQPGGEAAFICVMKKIK